MRVFLWAGGLVGVVLLVANGVAPVSHSSFESMAVGILLICTCLIGLFVSPKERRT